MESNTLSTIQTVSKIGRILSSVVHICCLIGGIGCIVGMVCVGVPGSIRVGGVTIYSMIDGLNEIDPGNAYMAMAAGLIFCVAGCILSKMAMRYFEHELAAGTPFTTEGANELLKLGICTICIPLGAVIVAEICYKVVSMRYFGIADMSFDGNISIGLGLAIIVASLVCKYGAEVTNKAS